MSVHLVPLMGFSKVWNLQGPVRLAPPVHSVQGSFKLGSGKVLPAEVLIGLQFSKSTALTFGRQELRPRSTLKMADMG